MIISGYADPQRNLYLRESVQILLHKRAIEMVRVRTSLAFYNRLFIVPKPNQKWRPVLDLSALNKFLSVKTFKMQTPETIRISLQQGEWVSSLDFSDACFDIPIHTGSQKYLRFHFQNLSYQFRSLPFGLSTAPMEFTGVVKEVKLMAQARGIRIHQYLDDWLIRAPTKESCHQGTQSLLALYQELGWVVNLEKSELDPKQVFEFVGYRYDLSHGLVKPTEPLGINSSKGGSHFGQSHLSSQEVHVPDRPSHCNRETSPTGKTAHEASSGASQETLEGSGISREGDSSSKVPSPTSSMVDQGDKCLNRPTPAPLASCNSNLYRRLKRRLGCSLRRLHNKRHLVSSRKPPSHKFPGTKGRPTSPKTFPAFGARESCLVATDNTTVVAYINKEGGMRSGSLCALLWRLLCWCNLRWVVLKARHIPGRLNVIADKLSRQGQVIQTEWSLHQPPDSNLAPSTGGHVCNKVQSQTTPIRVPSTGSQCLGSGRFDSFLGKPGHVCLSPSIVTRKSGPQTIRSPLQESDHNSPGLAQHAMVLGSSGTIIPDPTVPAQPSRPSDSTIQQGSSQQPNQPKPSRMAPRAEAIKEQGFSSPVASRIEAPQRSSTRTVYEVKWAVFVRWCETSQVDFRTPICQTDSRFPPTSLPGEESAAQHNRGLQIGHCRQIGQYFL